MIANSIIITIATGIITTITAISTVIITTIVAIFTALLVLRYL